MRWLPFRCGGLAHRDRTLHWTVGIQITAGMGCGEVGGGFGSGYNVRGMSGSLMILYTEGVRVLWVKCLACVALVLVGLPVRAEVAPLKMPDTLASRKIVAARAVDDGTAIRESLRRDIRLHPGDFVVFETEVGAARFVAEHRADAQPERNERLVSRGVVGYWQGKIVVVLPWGPVKNFQ